MWINLTKKELTRIQSIACRGRDDEPEIEVFAQKIDDALFEESRADTKYYQELAIEAHQDGDLEAEMDALISAIWRVTMAKLYNFPWLHTEALEQVVFQVDILRRSIKAAHSGVKDLNVDLDLAFCAEIERKYTKLAADHKAKLESKKRKKRALA